jgi:signal transduction histidine kinase/ActR/RegA family two-component response regulator
MQSAQPLPDDEAATALAAARAEALALREQLSKVERRLQAREGLLKGLSQHIPGVLFKVLVSGDGDTRMVYISERAAEIYELDDIDPQTLTWASHYVRIHPDDLAMVQDLSRSVCAHPGELKHYEYRVELPRKGLRWMAGQSVGQPEGEFTAWYGYVQDVTEQKLYAEALIQAQTAERANQAKSEFLSRMSHELRTPLNAVIGFAQLLQMDRGNLYTDEHRRRVGLIEQAGQHLLSILGDVLDLSRIEAGDLPLKVQALPLDAVVAEAVNLVAEQARRSQVTLDVRASAMPWHVQADRVRLRQVLVNLLSNAIKYNRADGRVTLSVRPAGAEVCVTVSDTGIGMAPEQLAQLFQPFNRLGVEQSGIEGTGIGLVIVQRLLNLMGGGIEVRSQAGQGSTFEVRLPAASAQAVVAQEPPLSDTPARSGTATILYAEDNEMNVALVHQVVRLRPHWQLLVAMSGKRAMEVARRKRPDLMLIDMHLGDMSGLELARSLDADPGTAGIPRVALSADAMPDRIRAAREQGFAAYLTKPLDVTALLRCLDDQLAPDEDV